MNYIILYITFFTGLFLFTLLFNSLLLKFVSTLGIHNSKQKKIRWSNNFKPSVGGITFFIVFLLSNLIFPFFSPEYSSNLFLSSPQFIGILSTVSLAFIMGLSDDAYDTNPLLKFSVQILYALILIWSNIYINIFQSLLLNYIITIIWVLSIMNAINLLDNMDAIATITSIFIILTFITILYLKKDFLSYDFFILVSILTALIAFLNYNWHPSKMFMGDTGSQFLGIVLSIFSIKCIWNDADAINIQAKNQFFQAIAKIIVVFAIPVIDTSSVVINRILSGKSPFIGGKDHTTHHISYLGFNDFKVAIIYTLISITSFITFLFIQLKEWKNSLFLFAISYFFIIFIILYIPTRFNRNRQK